MKGLHEYIFRGSIKKGSYKLGDVLTKNGDPFAVCIIETNEIKSSPNARFLPIISSLNKLRGYPYLDANSVYFPEEVLNEYDSTQNKFDGSYMSNIIASVAKDNGITGYDGKNAKCVYYLASQLSYGDTNKGEWYVGSAEEYRIMFRKKESILKMFEEKNIDMDFIFYDYSFITSNIRSNGLESYAVTDDTDFWIYIDNWSTILPLMQK